MAGALRISRMLPFHWEQVAKIYLEGIQTGSATLGASIPIRDIGDMACAQIPRLVTHRNDVAWG